MDSVQHSATFLAATFASGPFDTESLIERASLVLAKRGRWLRPLAGRLARAFAGTNRPRKHEIADFLLADNGFQNAYANDRIQFADLLIPPPSMVPAQAATHWREVPNLTTPRELSQWLGLSMGQLAWFADRRHLIGRQDNPRLQHYRYRLLEKRPGEYRLIEAPKPRLKAIQRQILAEILDQVPPHEASHGFRQGRSIASFAEPHIGKAVVLKMDLEDFFPSIGAAQVLAIFHFLGYPEAVADLLTGLCTSATPSHIWPSAGPSVRRHAQRITGLYSRPHLPQGAPTSPALANLCAWRMDLRLAALADKLGATYTRYADDLAFSGDEHFARASQRFVAYAAAIAIDQGYRVHFRKTRIMKQAARQKLAGIVVNQRLSIPRKDVDRLKAILTNCVRHGPSSQNHAGHPDYRSHLEGRVSFVEQIHPDRGRRLRSLLGRIDWSE